MNADAYYDDDHGYYVVKLNDDSRTTSKATCELLQHVLKTAPKEAIERIFSLALSKATIKHAKELAAEVPVRVKLQNDLKSYGVSLGLYDFEVAEAKQVLLHLRAISWTGQGRERKALDHSKTKREKNDRRAESQVCHLVCKRNGKTDRGNGKGIL